MKKLFSTILALALIMSLSVPVHAEVYADGKKLDPPYEVDEAQYVYADAAGDSLTVNGDVTGDSQKANNSVIATNGAEISVVGTVSGELSWPGDTVYASDSSTVTVGNVEDNGKGNAINATYGATVTVADGGEVIDNDTGNAINAIYGATVTVNGDISESGSGNAINAQEATIIVVGNVNEEGDGTAISAVKNATVIVGGDVIDGDSTSASDAVASGFNATVIVEGLVTGDLTTNGNDQTKSGTIFLGELKGDIKDGSDLGKIHYLIGSADNSPVKLIAVDMLSNCAGGLIYGANKEGYRYTETADPTVLKGKQITLQPAAGKILTVSGFNGADVNYAANADGTVTFTIGDTFIGGLQNLVLIVVDKPDPDPDPKPAPLKGPATVVEGLAVDDIEGVELFNKDARACLLFSKEFAEKNGTDIKVYLGDEEVSPANYTVNVRFDGTVLLVFSNTYLLSLGEGEHTFRVAVGEQEFNYTVGQVKK